MNRARTFKLSRIVNFKQKSNRLQSQNPNPKTTVALIQRKADVLCQTLCRSATTISLGRYFGESRLRLMKNEDI